VPTAVKILRGCVAGPAAVRGDTDHHRRPSPNPTSPTTILASGERPRPSPRIPNPRRPIGYREGQGKQPAGHSSPPDKTGRGLRPQRLQTS
jgi:hypothetical protein